MITIKNERELEVMRQACKITAAARALAGEMVRPGVSTKAIDQAVHDFIVSQGAKPSFLNYGGYPASACISVNSTVIHGIPGHYTLKEGDIVFNNSNALHSGAMENHQDCSYIPVTFDPRLIYGFFQRTINSKYVDPVIQDPRLPAVCIDQSETWHSAFRNHLLAMISLDQKKPEFYELDITIHLQMMWRLLLSHITYEPQDTQENSPDYDRLKKILSYIEENYSHPITLKDISGHIHLCESECTRMFKRHMNTTLFTYLQEYRIERSLEDLCKGTQISIVAENAGFSDSNYYSKVFAKVKGCSPREYRKRQ